MKIASLVSYKFMPAHTGGQKAIYLFLKYLSAHYDVICYSTKNNEADAHENFVVRKVLSNKRWRYINPLYFLKLKRHLRNDRITHLILEQPYLGWLGVLLKKSLGVKLVIRSHNIEALRFKTMGKWWSPMMEHYEKWVHRKCDFSFFISEEDMNYAVNKYKLDQAKTAILTYGTEKLASPSAIEKKSARTEVLSFHSIPDSHCLLLFNGALSYQPNRSALDEILETINPKLSQAATMPYTIVICGSSLPGEYNELQTYREQHIVYAGFVKDIDLYFTAADIFINPVMEGGGIKTKLVEALAAGEYAVSYESGAQGVPNTVTGDKMLIVENEDADTFVIAITKKMKQDYTPAPPSFYEHFFWGNIAKQGAGYLAAIP